MGRRVGIWGAAYPGAGAPRRAEDAEGGWHSRAGLPACLRLATTATQSSSSWSEAAAFWVPVSLAGEAEAAVSARCCRPAAPQSCRSCAATLPRLPPPARGQPCFRSEIPGTEASVARACVRSHTHADLILPTTADAVSPTVALPGARTRVVGWGGGWGDRRGSPAAPSGPRRDRACPRHPALGSGEEGLAPAEAPSPFEEPSSVWDPSRAPRCPPLLPDPPLRPRTLSAPSPSRIPGSAARGMAGRGIQADTLPLCLWAQAACSAV